MDNITKQDDFTAIELVPQPPLKVVRKVDPLQEDIDNWTKGIATNQAQIIHFRQCIDEATLKLSSIKNLGIKSEKEESLKEITSDVITPDNEN